MPSRACCKFLSLAVLLIPCARPQAGGPHVVSLEPAAPIAARRGTTLEVPLRFNIRSGYHVNSNAPAEEYLIPTALTWAEGPIASRGVTYPKAESVKYEFSSKPLLVYSGAFTLVTRFAVPADAPKGDVRLTGKLRYQACNEKMCLPPRTLELGAPVTIQ